LISVPILILFGLGINIDLEMQRNYFLILHNSYREVYDYDDLARSPEIEKMAQESADYIMEKFSKNEAYEIPNNTYKGEQLAKNIFWGKDQIIFVHMLLIIGLKLVDVMKFYHFLKNIVILIFYY